MITRRRLIKLFALAPIAAAIPIEFTAEPEYFSLKRPIPFTINDFEKIIEAAARKLAEDIDNYIGDYIINNP